MTIHNPRPNRSLVLTKRGWIAAIVLAADRCFVVPACTATDCREHVSRDGLCRRHVEHRDRDRAAMLAALAP